MHNYYHFVLLLAALPLASSFGNVKKYGSTFRRPKIKINYAEAVHQIRMLMEQQKRC